MVKVLLILGAVLSLGLIGFAAALVGLHRALERRFL